MTRIAFIGAGSVVFTKNLLGDILDFPALRDVEIALHDIDPDRLETAEAMARYVAGERGASPRISAHLDRRAAIDGADFVLNMVQIGGHEATLRDFEIPARYGLRQTIADTLGIGGIFRDAAHRRAHARARARDRRALPAEAWLLNYTNPMAALCELVYTGNADDRTSSGSATRCSTRSRSCAELVGVPAERGDVPRRRASTTRRSSSASSATARASTRASTSGSRPTPSSSGACASRSTSRLGFFPTESSEHAAEYVPWFMAHDDEIERYRIPVDEYIRRSEANLEEYERVKAALARGEAMSLKRSNEYASSIVNSIVTGEPCVIYGNVPNTGLIPGCPKAPASRFRASSIDTGVRPTPVPDYPAQLAALNRTYASVVELTVRAVLEGRPDHIRHAAMLDPNAPRR